MSAPLKRVLGLGVLAGVGYAAWRAVQRQPVSQTVTWEPQPFPFPPQPRSEDPGPTPETGDGAPWVDATDGACPASHPVKTKLASGIFHIPGGASYERTQAERCYSSPAAAEADGLRAAKR